MSQVARLTSVPAPLAPVKGRENDGNQVIIELSEHARKFAAKAWTDYQAVLGLQAKIASKLGNISQHVLTIAKEAVASTYQGPELSIETRTKLALSRFNAALAAGLAAVTEAHADVDATVMQGFTKTWGQYASNIRKGINKGVDVRDFDSETSIRAAVQAMKPKNAGSGGGDHSPTAGMTEEQKETVRETQQAAVAVAKESDKIAQGVQAVLMALKEADIDKHEDDILECLELCRKNLARFKLKTPSKGAQQGASEAARMVQA